jgi:hypothetical protein
MSGTPVDRASGHARPAAPAGAVVPGALWFGLFGAPVAWSLQLLSSYALVAHGCYPAAVPRAMPIVAGLRTVVLGGGGVALLIALVAGGIAWRSWGAMRGEPHGANEGMLKTGEDRTRFMALAGILLSAVFLLGIVMNAIPVVLLRPCT